MKRLISADVSEILKMNSKELKQSIKASDGRVVLSENFAPRESWVGEITNAEIAASFGADLILLNGIDVLNPEIAGLPDQSKGENPFETLRKLCGRPIGVGRTATETTLEKINESGLDFVCLTGNPGTGVTNEAIIESVGRAKCNFDGLIFAGKMHSAGVSEPVINLDFVKRLIEAGADVILIPSIGTVPGITLEMAHDAVELCHLHDVLAMSAIGTSQEGSGIETIRWMALQNKIAGVDIQHIGDAGYSGVAPVENIFELSKAIRGLRHTVSKMSRSILR